MSGQSRLKSCLGVGHRNNKTPKIAAQIALLHFTIMGNSAPARPAGILKAEAIESVKHMWDTRADELLGTDHPMHVMP